MRRATWIGSSCQKPLQLEPSGPAADKAVKYENRDLEKRREKPERESSQNAREQNGMRDILKETLLHVKKVITTKFHSWRLEMILYTLQKIQSRQIMKLLHTKTTHFAFVSAQTFKQQHASRQNKKETYNLRRLVVVVFLNTFFPPSLNSPRFTSNSHGTAKLQGRLFTLSL